jgi:outer membrane protein
MEQGYQKGLKSIIDVLEAQAKLHQVRLDMIDSGFELINNHVTLLDLVGELNQENVRVLDNMITR